MPPAVARPTIAPAAVDGLGSRRRQLAWTARQTLGAKVGVSRGAPERSRARLVDGARGVTRAHSSRGPPGHGHVAAIDRMESVLRTAPKDAIRTVRTDRHRLGRDAFAAPLIAVRLRPMGGFIAVDRRFRRAARTQAFVLPELAPESAGRAIGRPDRLVAHRLLSLFPPGLERGSRKKAEPGFSQRLREIKGILSCRDSIEP